MIYDIIRGRDRKKVFNRYINRIKFNIIFVKVGLVLCK